MEGDQNRQNFDAYHEQVRMQMYGPGTTHPSNPLTDLPYPLQVGVNFQQAHMVEADEMSMGFAGVGPQSHNSSIVFPRISGPDTTRPSNNGFSGAGLQSVSGFSNDNMNNPGNGHIQVVPSTSSRSRDIVRPLLWQDQQPNNGAVQQSVSGFSDYWMNDRGNTQMLPSTGNGCNLETGISNGGACVEMDDVAIERNRELIQRLKSKVEDYEKKKDKCTKSFIDIGFNRKQAEANGSELRYFTNVGNEVMCLQCRSRADRTDKFHHRDDCLVYKTLKEIGDASSDEDSLPQRCDSDESMESAENEPSCTSGRELVSANEFEPTVPVKLEPVTGFQSLSSDDSLFRSGNDTDVVLPTDGKSKSTITQLRNMGYEVDIIQAIFRIQGGKCLQSAEDFLYWEEISKKSSNQSNASSYMSVQQCPSSSVSAAPVPDVLVSGDTLPSRNYVTAGGYSQGETSSNSFLTSESGGRVHEPPMLRGADNVNRDYEYCLACKRERAWVNQKPCGHVVCKTCGDRSNVFCNVCGVFVTYRGIFDIASTN
ncbi:uncharacterized protein LOC128555776 [Mercenaria mercenaria]|uniref:uncharacterized protein LOC128555776 n=1 Tax=Mercenaria mercenaria TaxID=6596 RepID=UPI00234F44BF|nr:uncharacterized protein LOC128555776 [Mercenaria mercenaria]XP_053395255.1 uncharacterized protein LOC128555776 [Mercenaria mercenaria]